MFELPLRLTVRFHSSGWIKEGHLSHSGQFQRDVVFNFLILRLTIQRGSDEEGIWFRTPLGMESSGGPQEICIFYLVISLLQYSLKGSMQLHDQDNEQFSTFVFESKHFFCLKFKQFIKMITLKKIPIFAFFF